MQAGFLTDADHTKGKSSSGIQNNKNKGLREVFFFLNIIMPTNTSQRLRHPTCIWMNQSKAEFYIIKIILCIMTLGSCATHLKRRFLVLSCSFKRHSWLVIFYFSFTIAVLSFPTVSSTALTEFLWNRGGNLIFFSFC